MVGATARHSRRLSHRRRRRRRSRKGWPRRRRNRRAPAAAAGESRSRTREARSRRSRPDIVVLCTSSSLRAVMPQIEGVLKAKVPIVTTTEELSYPVKRNASLAQKDRRAGEESESGRALDRREPRVRDGCAANHADRRMRAHRVGDGDPHSGCAHAAAALSAENRRRAVARAVPA